MMRRWIAFGAAVLILVLLVIGIRACVSSQRQQALRDYNRDVASLVQESDTQVGVPFFETLSGAQPAGDAIAVEQTVNGYRELSDELVRRAEDLDAPGSVSQAQRNLVLVLQLRRDALARIASKLSAAFSRDQSEEAVAQITGQMQAFLASDVVYSQQVVPRIKQALDDAGVTGQTIQQSRFLPDINWLSESFVAQALSAAVTGRAVRGGPPAPGLHGHGLTSVSVGDVTLEEGVSNRIPAGGDIVFNVTFENQGENDEADVLVTVTVEGEGAGQAITAEQVVPDSAQGTETTAEVPLGQAPPLGVPATVTVEVEPVPGEENTDNNTLSYQALFEP